MKSMPFSKFWEKTARLSFLLFLVFLPLNAKKLIFLFSRGLNDASGIFLYVSDIFLLIFLLPVLRAFHPLLWHHNIGYP